MSETTRALIDTLGPTACRKKILRGAMASQRSRSGGAGRKPASSAHQRRYRSLRKACNCALYHRPPSSAHC